MRTAARRLLIAVAAFVVVTALVLWSVHQAAQRVPDFYQRALAAPATTLHEDGQRFEEQALALHNQLQHPGRWEVHFTQDEVNGWLAAELPAKFPLALPPGLSEPRIAIDRGVVHLAVRCKRGGMDTVMSLIGKAHLTDEPNELAIHITQVRAGSLPVPLGRFLDEITQRAAEADIPIRWTEAEGAPVALIRLPIELEDRRQFLLERFEFGDRELAVAGRTERELPQQGNPTAPATAAQPAESEIRQR